MNVPEAPFVLAVRRGKQLNSNIWYMPAPLGKNMIGNFLAKAAERAGIQRRGSKISNHSVRKTCISRLLDADVPENFASQLSGHKNTESLQSYKSAGDKQQRQMSYALSRQALTSRETTICHQPKPSAERPFARSWLRGTSGLPSQSYGAAQEAFAVANIGSFSDCMFQVFNGPVTIVQQPKRQGVVTESDDEDLLGALFNRQYYAARSRDFDRLNKVENFLLKKLT